MHLLKSSVSAAVLAAVFTSSTFAYAHPYRGGHYRGGRGGNAIVNILSSVCIGIGVTSTADEAGRHKAEIQELRNVASKYLSDAEESPILEEAVYSYEKQVLKIEEENQEEDLSPERVTGFLTWLNQF